MNRYLITITLIVCFFTAKSQSLKANYDSLFHYLERKDNFNGNVLVADKGKVVYQRSFGYANFKTGERLNENSAFYLASLTKQFTAMGIMILEKQGKLKLSDKLTKYYPQLRTYGNISIKNLLNHTSGMPDYMELMAQHWDKTKIAFNNDVIAALVKYHPKVAFKPGYTFEYSNTGYVLLASVIEKASGTSYADFLSRHIFKPLQMNRSRVYNTRLAKHEIVKNYAYGYIITKNNPKPTSQDSIKESDYLIYLDGIVGDGGIISTTTDLLKWDRALYTDKLISNQKINEMFSTTKLGNGREAGYGYGWGVVPKDTVAGKYVAHNGGWGGYDTHIARFIGPDKTIIVLRNITNNNTVDDVEDSYISILFNNKLKLPAVTANKD
ncbi:class A beta-lactamase-related serine hydrolase [Mucilaginibacter conchicola]|uniref:Class A beta-lactamase-related serine hydrolase n=1 Tax=Mucilaginibacter conchicola TaxID=2303333 RepID=A0A372NN95_9SPHI|nr:serine hydrolase domain-containing protein [Mucilaginibacter conchicola]RFZ90394.1 class A beta-lactamase-related serine hydrolase [Mucilaginibacter conchicola]